MKKILPLLCLSLFLASSCEDDDAATEVTCTTLLADLIADPFATQMQEVDFTNPPADWKTNCEAYAVKMQDLVDAGYQQTGINHLFKEDAYYDQVTLQLEFEAFDVNSVLGVFNYHIHSYNSDNDIPSVDTPGAELEFTDSREYFYPGLGAPLAILTDKAFMYQFQKDVGKENDLVLNMKGVNDLENDGYLYEVGFIYNLNGDIKIHSYINKVFGDNTQDDEYRFNQMEDFSHFRLELEYFF